LKQSNLNAGRVVIPAETLAGAAISLGIATKARVTHMHYSDSFEQIRRDFEAIGIPTDNPGFYDHSQFMNQERVNADFLNHYAKFVRSQTYDLEYLAKARAAVIAAAEELHNLLVKDGRLGACIDCSMAFSRMLDKEGIWNYAVKGAVTIEFPPALRAKRFTFWPIDVDRGRGGEYGHKWVSAPPFDIVDVTIKQQEYGGPHFSTIPGTILEEILNPIIPVSSEICSPPLIRDARERGIPDEEIMYFYNPRLRDFFRVFPANLISRGDLRLRYVPCAIAASDCRLEEITSLKLNGIFANEVYECHIAPKLRALGR
jgi:hypothetical protein